MEMIPDGRLARMVLVFLWITGPVPEVSLAQSECCPTSGRPDTDEVVRSAARGRFEKVVTRFDRISGKEVEVEVKYSVHAPEVTKRGLVVLIAGGVMETGLDGGADTGRVTSVGSNFLVRSAHHFAEQGFLAVTLNRPSTTVGYTKEQFDRYRVSPAHAQDIVAVVSRVNVDNLNVFLVGTSRGTLSAVAQHELGTGISLSSPVTSPSGNKLYIGRPGFPNLDPRSVGVPVHVLAHVGDGCRVTRPMGSLFLWTDFLSSGVPAVLDFVYGGFESSDNLCDGLTHHGFLGIETDAVRRITGKCSRLLYVRYLRAPKNERPVAQGATFSIRGSRSLRIDLSPLARDADNDQLTFSLVHDVSTRGAGLSVRRSTVTYVPRGTSMTDGFVYGVSDGNGGISHAVVTVEVCGSHICDMNDGR